MAAASQVDVTITSQTSEPFPASLVNTVSAVEGVRVVSGSLERTLGFPYHPHVTVAHHLSDDLALADLLADHRLALVHRGQPHDHDGRISAARCRRCRRRIVAADVNQLRPQSVPQAVEEVTGQHARGRGRTGHGRTLLAAEGELDEPARGLGEGEPRGPGGDDEVVDVGHPAQVGVAGEGPPVLTGLRIAALVEPVAVKNLRSKKR